jgi:hypothetical protein
MGDALVEFGLQFEMALDEARVPLGPRFLRRLAP